MLVRQLLYFLFANFPRTVRLCLNVLFTVGPSKEWPRETKSFKLVKTCSYNVWLLVVLLFSSVNAFWAFFPSNTSAVMAACCAMLLAIANLWIAAATVFNRKFSRMLLHPVLCYVNISTRLASGECFGHWDPPPCFPFCLDGCVLNLTMFGNLFIGFGWWA